MYHEFCDHCPGCRPALVDVRTGQALPKDKEPMISILRMWRGQTSYAERKAYIQVKLHNSRNKSDIQLAFGVVEKIQRILNAHDSSAKH